jgi:hypothetical protein
MLAVAKRKSSLWVLDIFQGLQIDFFRQDIDGQSVTKGKDPLAFLRLSHKVSAHRVKDPCIPSQANGNLRASEHPAYEMAPHILDEKTAFHNMNDFTIF